MNDTKKISNLKLDVRKAHICWSNYSRKRFESRALYFAWNLLDIFRCACSQIPKIKSLLIPIFSFSSLHVIVQSFLSCPNRPGVSRTKTEWIAVKSSLPILSSLDWDKPSRDAIKTSSFKPQALPSQSRITNHKLQITNPQFQVSNSQFPVSSIKLPVSSFKFPVFPSLPFLLAIFLLVLITGCKTTTITSEPPGADVWLNDKYIGKTPIQEYTVKQEVGHINEYRFKAFLEGYEIATKIFHESSVSNVYEVIPSKIHFKMEPAKKKPTEENTPPTPPNSAPQAPLPQEQPDAPK